MKSMKKILAVLALGMFVMGAIVGCEASAKVGDSDTDGGYVKKTTTVQQSDGDRTTKTEIKHVD